MHDYNILDEGHTADAKCPHCGSDNGTWVDRAIVLDADGDDMLYEAFATRCEGCGKNVYAPKDYYMDKTPNTSAH